MLNSRLWIQTCVLFLTCFVFTGSALARSSFDGAWSVVVVTRAGACTPTLRYPVAITNGIVTNDGGSPASVTGRVAPTGAVRVAARAISARPAAAVFGEDKAQAAFEVRL